MAQVSSGDFPNSFLKGDCGLDLKCSLKKGCKSVCASDRADQMRGKVTFGEDAGSTRVSKSFAMRQRLLVAEEDCVINPSFPIEVHFTGNAGGEEMFLTKKVEDPRLVKVRAMVGCRSIVNENPMLVDMRQVPGVSFLTPAARTSFN